LDGDEGHLHPARSAIEIPSAARVAAPARLATGVLAKHTERASIIAERHDAAALFPADWAAFKFPKSFERINECISNGPRR
jgi:hypothetical protein